MTFSAKFQSLLLTCKKELEDLKKWLSLFLHVEQFQVDYPLKLCQRENPST